MKIIRFISYESTKKTKNHSLKNNKQMNCAENGLKKDCYLVKAQKKNLLWKSIQTGGQQKHNNVSVALSLSLSLSLSVQLPIATTHTISASQCVTAGGGSLNVHRNEPLNNRMKKKIK